MGGSTVEGLIKGNTFRNEDITVSDPSLAGRACVEGYQA